MPIAPWNFIAMQYYGLILNRTYRVYVTDLYLCAARVRGLLASPLAPNEEWYDPEFYVHQSLASQYDQIDPTSPAFLAQDRANFQLARHTIASITYYPKKWGMGAVPYSGRLVLKTSANTNHEFILLGRQDAEAIRTRLLP